MAKMESAEVYRRKHEADRTAWALEMLPNCMWCGTPNGLPYPLEVHEIERRSHAPNRWADRSNYLLLCHVDHAGPFATMAHVTQLACKAIWDAKHLNVPKWLRLRDPGLRAPNRVTLDEVLAEVDRLMKEHFSKHFG